MFTDADIAAAAAHLKRGGVVIYPTGSFLAAGVLAILPDAVTRLRTLKGRPGDKPFGLIVAAADGLADRGILMSPAERKLAARFWPGPLSLVLTLSPSSPLAALYPAGTVAVRVPAHPVARALAIACREMITATSANRSGVPPVTTACDLGPEWQTADVLVLGDQPAGGGLPSSVVAVRDGVPHVLRPGRLPAAELVAAS
ncbi:MAG: L-threonylcarbamoyladenylate synthase [Nitrospirota bacterium]|jgi:L-threonylcarbamoyladenylate synthase